MRRLLRWTFNALAAASLLVCVATGGLWVRSYSVADELHAWRVSHIVCNVTSARGQLGVVLLWSERPWDEPKSPWHVEIQHPIGSDVNFTGFAFRTLRWNAFRSDPYNTNMWIGAAPAWSLVSAFAVLPAIATFRQIRAVRRRRRSSRLGLCPACEYDLRASPGRCPECGRGR